MAERPKPSTEEFSRFPLRLFQIDGKSTVVCPYETHPSDTATVEMLEDIPRTVRINLIAQVDQEKYQLPRDLLISHAKDKRLITMSGYADHNDPGRPVEVYAWQDRYGYEGPNEEMARRIIMRQIEMSHVEGFENAVAHHRQRVKDVELKDITIEEAIVTYEAMVYTAPKY